MAPKVERILDCNHTLGEGPHWDEATQTLYLVDIFCKTIHKFVPATKEHTQVVAGDANVSLVIPVAGTKDQFLIPQKRILQVVKWDGVSDKISVVKTVGEIDNRPGALENVFNDGKCDPSGRFWGGSISGTTLADIRSNGSLVSITNGKLATHLTTVGISNGLAFDTDLKKFYYVDTHIGTVDQFDFDLAKGQISNRKTVFTAKAHEELNGGIPDGMAIDTDGNLWVALFNGYSVIKIDPRKPEKISQKIDIPAKQVTSVAFGGPKLDELYVTTGRLDMGDGEELKAPENGALYKVTGLGVKGLAGVSVKL